MKIPIREFFKNRSKSNFILSPDNKQIAYLDTYKKRRNIFIKNLKTNKVQVVTKQQSRNISTFGWKNNDHIYYLQDNDGDENYHLFLIELTKNVVKEITPGKKLKVSSVDSFNKHVYFKNRNDLINKLLIFHNEKKGFSFDAYIYDINDNSKELIEEYEIGETPIIINEDTFKADYTVVTKKGFSIIKKNGQEIKKVSSKDEFNLLGYTSEKKNELYVVSNLNRDKKALFKFDANLSNLKGDLIFEDKDVDITSAKIDFLTHKLQYTSYSKDKDVIKYFDLDLKNKHIIWKKEFLVHFPDEKDSNIFFSAVPMTNDKVIYIDSFSDKKLLDEYIWLVNEKKIIKLTNDEKYLNPSNLVEMQPISYIARDGLKIHGYLTMPKNKKGPIPIIVNPHGGPWVRDYWGYNSEAQYFANRGFGWFQMNFRISTGYGKNHFLKGWKQWGLSCQDDITDGTHWLIEKGYTKKGMIGIYGGSYGGYATLMGIIKEPKLYSAAVDYVGVSDLFSFWDGFPKYWKIPGNIFEEALGNPYENEEYAKKASPFYNIDKIKTPLMIVQGANDPRVPQKQSDIMVKSLRKRGVDVEYILKKDEGHGFANQENKIELYEKMTTFFNKFLKNNN